MLLLAGGFLQAPFRTEAKLPARLAASALSGLALSLAYVGPLTSLAGPELAFLAPAAFLGLAVRSRPGRAAAVGAVFGLALGAPSLAWIGGVTWLGCAGVVLFFVLSFAGVAALVSFTAAQTRLPVSLVAPPVWVAFELLRAHAFTGFPWLLLGHAISTRLVLVQIADLGGAYAVSFVVALWNASLVDLARCHRNVHHGGTEPRTTARPPQRHGDTEEERGERRNRTERSRSRCLRASVVRRWREVIAAASVLALTAAYGTWRLASIETREGPELILIQGNIYTPRAAEGDEASEEVDDEIWRVQGKLSREAVRQGRASASAAPGRSAEGGTGSPGGARAAGTPGSARGRTEGADAGPLLVWSESMLPGYYNDPGDLDAAIWSARLELLLGDLELPLLAGSNATGLNPAVPQSGPFGPLRGPPSPPSERSEEAGRGQGDRQGGDPRDDRRNVAASAEGSDVGPAPPGRIDYNSALLLNTNAEIIGRYDKMHLVPFGEYVPLAGLPVFSGLTPYTVNDPGYAQGDPAQPLMVWPPRAAKGGEAATGEPKERAESPGSPRFGVLICYEDVFPELARRAARLGADFLVNLSSEAWFAGSPEVRQHFLISRFRAIETRLPLVRCCNVGVTAFIDPAGRVVRMLEGSDRPEGAQGWLRGRVPLARAAHSSAYAAIGDVFAWACAASAAGMVALAAVRHRRLRAGAKNASKCP